MMGTQFIRVGFALLAMFSIMQSFAHAQTTAAEATVTTAPGSAAEAILLDTVFLRPDAPGHMVGASQINSESGSGGIVTLPLGLLFDTNGISLEEWRQNYFARLASWSALSIGVQTDGDALRVSQGLSVVLHQPGDSRLDLEWDACIDQPMQEVADAFSYGIDSPELREAQTRAAPQLKACRDEHIARQRPGTGVAIAVAVQQSGRFGDTEGGERFIDDFGLDQVDVWLTAGVALGEDFRLDLAARTSYDAREDILNVDAGAGLRWTGDMVSVASGASWAPRIDVSNDHQDYDQLGYEGEVSIRLVDQSWVAISGGFDGLEDGDPTNPNVSVTFQVNP